MTLNGIITIGKGKDGDMDFSVSAAIGDLDHQQMKEFRAMCMVAIGTAENMYRRAQESKPEHQTYSEKSATTSKEES